MDLIHEKHQITLPIGTIWYYKPFYVTEPTEKEKLLCLFKVCLNERLMFEPLHNEIGESLSGFMMGNCQCDRNENGFWKIKCCK